MSTVTSGAAADPIVQSPSKGAASKEAATDANGKVRVRPIKPYLCSATNEHRSADSEPYAVEPYQAADLVRNGVAEYADPADEDAAIEARIKSEGEAIRAARRPR